MFYIYVIEVLNLNIKYMYTKIIENKAVNKSYGLKDWCYEKFESIVGEYPEVEEKVEKESEDNTPILKKYKLLRYLVFPVVLVLIILDESYIRIRDYVKKIDESE